MPGRNTEFSDAAERLEDLKDDINEEMNEAAESVMENIADTASRKAPVANTPVDANLSTSIDYVGDNTAGLHAVVAKAPYAAYVEYGTGASQDGSPMTGGRYKSPSVAPYGAILEWMKSKPVQPEASGIAALERSAWLIATKIRNQGSDPHPFMRPAWKQNYHQFRTRGRLRLRKAAEDNFR
jgi:HK97 gp10 family phage protein